MRTPDDLRQLLTTAAAEAPPMHLEPDAVIAGAHARRRRTVRRAVGTLAAAAALLTAVVLGATGPLGDLSSSTEPASVPEWDTTRGFSTVVETGLSTHDGEELHGPVPALEVTRDAGAERFTVTDTTTGEQLDGAPAEGMPGSELVAGEDFAVLLVPAPAGVDGRNSEWLFDWSALGNSGVGQTARVVEDGGQSLLVHTMVGATPVPPDRVGEVVWEVNGTVGTASRGTVHQAEVASGGERLVVWRSPEADLVGAFVDAPDGPWASDFSRHWLYEVPVRTEGAEEVPLRHWRYAVLPEGAHEVRAVLDDEVGTVVPFETVPLGSETPAYRLLDGVDVAQSDTGVFDLSWRDASGAPRHLSDLVQEAEAARGQEVELDGEVYQLRSTYGPMVVTVDGAEFTVPAEPYGGVAVLPRATRALAVVPLWSGPSQEVVLVPRAARAEPLVRTAGVPSARVELDGGDEVLLAALPPAGPGAAAEPVAALAVTEGESGCRLDPPPGVPAATAPVPGLRGAPDGMLLHLPDQHAWAVCVGGLVAGGVVDGTLAEWWTARWPSRPS